MFILRLDPPVELVTRDGPVRAFLVIDRGADADLEWVCWRADRQCWSYLNRDVRQDYNVTEGRMPMTVDALFEDVT